MSEDRVRHRLIIFSDNDNLLYTFGTFDDEEQALLAVNPAIDDSHVKIRWRIIRVTEEVVREGTGRIPRRQGEPAPSGQGRWW